MNMALVRSGGLCGSGRNDDAVPSFMVVVAQDNFLVDCVKTVDGQNGVYVSRF